MPRMSLALRVKAAAAATLAGALGAVAVGPPSPPAEAHALPPEAPLVPGGVADARGHWVFVGGASGGVDAVDLATGKRGWTSTEGEWPLYAALDALAVAAPVAAPKSGLGAAANVLRVRFVGLGTGRRLSESAPIVLPDWVDVHPPWRGGRTSFSCTAWRPLPTRVPVPDPHRGAWRLNWEARHFSALGGKPKVAEGTAYVDATTGAVEMGPTEPPGGPVPPALPDGWKPEPGAMYWAWFDDGGSPGWTGTPRPFRFGGGVMGYLAVEGGVARRLVLHRWRPFEPLAPVEIAAGDDSYRVLLALDARHLVVTARKGTVDTSTLYDLYTVAKTGPSARLPPFEPGFVPPLTLLGPSLLYVVERRDPAGRAGGGFVAERSLVAVDWAAGTVRWSYPLAPRAEPPPSASGSSGRP
jgi:outer membrane protein assembly factor BamB